MSASEAERSIMVRLRGLAQAPSATAARSELARIAPRPVLSEPGDVSATCDSFLERAKANGFSAEAVAGRSEAVHAVAAYISARQNHRRFVAGHDARLAAMPWRDAGLLPRFGVATAEDQIAVSYARCAIAETGSVGLWADRDNPALNNLLCDAQIILVNAGDVRQSLNGLWEEREFSEAAGGPRGIMMVSGPSSTADIGMQLVLGAHGPRAVHIILLEGRA
ncbi:MAG: LUD domain-containing protein [Pseudomonadota bacterium]